MSRIAILTTGTRGDVQPFVALGAALRKQGHVVTMTAPLDLVALVAAGDVEAVAQPFSAQQVLGSELGQRFLAEGNMIAFLRALGELDALHRPALVDAYVRAGQGADVVVGHPLTMGPALALARAHGARLACCFLHPTASTSAVPTPLLDLPDLGPLNRASHALVLAIAGRIGAKTTQAVARRLGVDAPRGSAFARAEELRALTLHLYSPALQPRPGDWAPHHVVTGMLMLDAQTRARLGERAPPAGLDAWLDAGTPPVFFGFGSMPVREPERMVALVDEVSAALDVRALVGAGWSTLRARDEGRVFIAPAFDHDTILPRCRAAVHHGGAGTTHTVVRAGLPAVVCHFLVDQPYWARRLIAHGIGARVPFFKLTAHKLIDALRPLLHDDVKERARALGAKLREEDGAAVAVRALVG